MLEQVVVSDIHLDCTVHSSESDMRVLVNGAKGVAGAEPYEEELKLICVRKVEWNGLIMELGDMRVMVSLGKEGPISRSYGGTVVVKWRV